MTTAISTIEARAPRSAPSCLLLTVAALLPALGYFVISMLGLAFGILRPVRWLMDGLFTVLGAWSIPVLLVLVVGGPTLSVMGSLILGARPRFGYRLSGLCGGIAVGLILLNTLLVMFYLPFAFED